MYLSIICVYVHGSAVDRSRTSPINPHTPHHNTITGDSTCVNRIKQEPPLKHPFPLCCLRPIARDGRFLRFCKQGDASVGWMCAYVPLVVTGNPTNSNQHTHHTTTQHTNKQSY